MIYFPSNRHFYIAHWNISSQEPSPQLLWLIPQGMNDRRHHERCPSFPVCPRIPNKEQKLISMVCLTHWATFPLMRWLWHNSISTNNMHWPLWNSCDVWYGGLCATILYVFILLDRFALSAQVVRCLGKGMSKFCLAVIVGVRSQSGSGEPLQSTYIYMYQR